MPPPDPPPPVHSTQRFADPSVTVAPSGLVATSTGASTPRATADRPAGPWKQATPALAALPVWATGPLVWAADIARVGDRWLLYYAAPVSGLGPDGRCIGVAVASAAMGEFRPVGSRPLVCPRRAKTPLAYDVVPGARKSGLPRDGVIDPSLFVDGRDLHLLYKTQGRPSSIRVVQLNGRGVRTARRDGGDVRSDEVLRSGGTVENPVVVRRGDGYVLFTSSGNFKTCRYRTMWRRSTDLTDFTSARSHVLLSRSRTGVCGPGGADLATRGGVSLMYFHGWMCGPPADLTHCPSRFALEQDSSLRPRRSMFAARMRWTDNDRPRLRFFLAPRVSR
jgi:arabinan endo-1,5-alpha-L-arabinosidase